MENDQSQDNNNEAVENDQGLGDWAAQTEMYTVEDREKLIANKKLTREKLIDMVISATKSYSDCKELLGDKNGAYDKLVMLKTSVEADKAVVTKKYNKAVDDLLRVQDQYANECKVSQRLLDQLGDSDNKNTPSKPVVILVSDESGEQLISKFDSSECRWELVQVNGIADFNQFWSSSKDKSKVLEADHVVVMLGRSDIMSGVEGYRLNITSVVEQIKEAGIPVTVSQILPPSDWGFKPDVDIFNRKLLGQKKKFSVVNLGDDINGKTDADEVFSKPATSLLTDDLAQLVTKAIHKVVGKPVKRQLPVQVTKDDDDDDDTECIEFIRIDAKEKGPLIGPQGTNIQEIETDNNCKLNAIEYRFNQYDDKIKHGVLITGKKKGICGAKIDVAGFLDKLSKNDDDDDKRPEKRKVAQPWPQAKKRGNLR